MKVIVTGSEGFIGSALCESLNRSGVEIVRIDKVLGSDAADMERYLEDGDYDCVYHLAAAVDNPDIELIRKENIDTFMRVADACRRHGVKLVYASSASAYAPNTISMYGISKRFDEMYAQVYCPSATGCRIHSAYGPNPRRGTLLWHLMNDASVRLWNHGRNKRCWTYIADVVEGLVYASASHRQLLNIVNAVPIGTLEFSAMVTQKTHVEVVPVAERRAFDIAEEVVESGVFVVPLRYTMVPEGVNRMFSAKR